MHKFTRYLFLCVIIYLFSHIAAAQTLSSPQLFHISSVRDTVLHCAKGSVLEIYKNSFEDMQGHELHDQTIDIQVTEITDKADMVLENMATITDSSYLATGGMIDIKAASNGAEVQLKKNSTIQITMNTGFNSIKPDLYLLDSTDTWVKTDAQVKSVTCTDYEKKVVYTEYRDATKKEFLQYMDERGGDWPYLSKREKNKYVRNQKYLLIPSAMDTVLVCKNAETNAYSFGIPATGYYNIDCHRSARLSREMRVFTTLKNAQCFIVIYADDVSVKSIFYKNSYLFRWLPAQAACYIVVYAIQENGDVKYSMQISSTENKSVTLNNFTTVAQDVFREKIKAINNK